MSATELQTLLGESGLDAEACGEWAAQISHWSELPDSELWQLISQRLLSPAVPFAVHQRLFAWVYRNRPTEQGPAPAWIPNAIDIDRSNLSRLMRARSLKSFEEMHAWSVRNRGEFWDTMIKSLEVPLHRPYSRVVSDPELPQPDWLVGAELNIAEACFLADSRRTAIVYRSEEEQALSEWTYGELEACSRRVAAAIRRQGLDPGSAVGLILPITPIAIACYLGVILAGCQAVCVADSFAASEMQRRLEIGRAKLVITQDVILRAGRRHQLYEKLREIEIPTVVVPRSLSDKPTLRGNDLSWNEFLADVEPAETYVARPGEVTTVLFSSGTTGDPKAIPWDHSTPIKGAVDAHLHHDVQPQDRIAWPTSMGWMMGPWLIFAGLVNRATLAVHEGGPTTADFCRFVEQAGVTILGVVPSLIRGWRESQAIEGCDWTGVRHFLTTGECSRPDDMLYLMSRAGYRPILEYCGGTELGGGYITGTVLQPCAPSTFTTPTLGVEIEILSAAGEPVNRGEAYLVPPSIGFSSRLLNGEHERIYYPVVPAAEPREVPLRKHGDELERLPGGHFRVHGRMDDCMNLGGVKVAAVEIEAVLNEVAGVSQSAAVAVPAAGGGPGQLVVFVVPVTDTIDATELRRAMQQHISERLNPLFKIHDVVLIDAIPRTASNKTIRRKLRDSLCD